MKVLTLFLALVFVIYVSGDAHAVTNKTAERTEEAAMNNDVDYLDSVEMNKIDVNAEEDLKKMNVIGKLTSIRYEAGAPDHSEIEFEDIIDEDVDEDDDSELFEDESDSTEDSKSLEKTMNDEGLYVDDHAMNKVEIDPAQEILMNKHVDNSTLEMDKEMHDINAVQIEEVDDLVFLEDTEIQNKSEIAKEEENMNKIQINVSMLASMNKIEGNAEAETKEMNDIVDDVFDGSMSDINDDEMHKDSEEEMDEADFDEEMDHDTAPMKGDDLLQ